MISRSRNVTQVTKWTDAGIVRTPWQFLPLADTDLNAGWYGLYCSKVVCLTLRDQIQGNSVELVAGPGAPAYVRLPTGHYTASLQIGGRPGIYGPLDLELKRLSYFKLCQLFGRRLRQALWRGASPLHVLNIIWRLIRTSKPQGVRANGDSVRKTNLLHAEPLSQPDIAERCRNLKHLPLFLVRYTAGAIAPSDGHSHGLDRQIYNRFTLDLKDDVTAIVVIDKSETLTEDALILAAEALDRESKADIIICDRLESGQSTLRAGFDPLLYASDLPTPYILRLPERPIPESWAEQQESIAFLPVPVAASFMSSMPRFSPLRNVPAASASIIIPTRDRADLLAKCLAGLFDKTSFPHEVIIVDNGSIEPETHALLQNYESKGLTCIRADMPFNFSRLCNLGARAAKGDYLVFLNNDIELNDPKWLERLVALAALDNAGAVGARLLYRDGRLQHGGIWLGVTGVCGHLWRGLSRKSQAYVPVLCHDSLRSAVTGAMLCLKTEKFMAVNGFDEVKFPVTLNDVDLCLRLRAKGWFTIFSSNTEAIHHEGESRGRDDDLEESQRRKAEICAFRERWGHLIDKDSWLHPAVMRSTEIFNYK